jgi:hypothetical protein
MPGAPGSAIGYAHVHPDGTLDSADSKGVAVLAHPGTGQYCLQVSGTFHNAIATPAMAESSIVISDTQGVPYIDLSKFTSCPLGTNLKIIMGKLSGVGAADWPFYVAVN